MLDIPVLRQAVIPNSPHISYLAYEATERRGASIAAPSSTAWPTANLGLLFEFVLEQPFTAASFFVFNGSAVSGNFDMAILAPRVNSNVVDRLYSTGSTAQSGTNNYQFVAQAFTLPPGTYLAELIFDNTTATGRGATASLPTMLESFGSAQVANGSVTIPSTQTLEKPTSGFMPIFGISMNTSF